jgi:hypothetical protein
MTCGSVPIADYRASIPKILESTFIVASYFKRILIPGAVPKNIAATVSYLAILVIFPVAVTTGSEIALQILYVFPIMMISFHCERKALVIGAVFLSVLLQVVTLLTYDISAYSKIIQMLMVLWSDVLIAFVSYYARIHILENTGQAK